MGTLRNARRAGKVRSGIQPPQLPKQAPVEELPGGRFEDEATYTDLHLANAVLSDQAAEGVLFERVHFKRVFLNGVNLASAQFIDVRLDGCDLTGAAWEKAHLNRVEVIGSRIMGLKLLDANVEDVLFKDSNGEFAMFWSSVFKRVRFENCKLSEASFGDANLSGVVFDKCDLTNANFQNATLAGADFRGSKLDGLRVGLKELQGAIIEPSQAVNVVGLLGITVKWD